SRDPEIVNSDFTHRIGIFGHLDRDKRRFFMTYSYSFVFKYLPSLPPSPLFRI
ncbi:Hypothetical protein FKW44_024896, partial [Caligus rogercresseyi]